MSTWTMAFSTALIDLVWQGAAVALLLWAALAALRTRSANARYAVSCAALAVLAMLPVVTAIALAMSTTASPPGPGTNLDATPAALAVPQTMLRIWMVPDAPRVAWLAYVQFWTVPIWSAGVLLFSVRLAWACRHAFAAGRGAGTSDELLLSSVARLSARIGVHRAVRVVQSSLTDGPGVVGWLRPVILLPPAAAMGLTPQQLEAVLAHELAHIRRHDYLVNMLQVVIETLLFYHPAVWWISRQIRTERELCCDDVAVQSSGDAVGYARALTMLARRRLETPAFTMAATGGPLMDRVQRLVGASAREYGPSRTPGMVALGLVLACVVVNLDWLQAFAGPQAADDVRFEVASVKRNNRQDRMIFDQLRDGRWTAIGYTVAGLIRTAYQVQEFQIVGGPGWIDSDKFDVLTVAPDDVPPGVPGATTSTHQLMLRALLAERFNLQVHKETREMPVFALVVARTDGQLGPQLYRSADNCTDPATRAGGATPPGAGSNPLERISCGTSVGPGLILAGGRTMAQIATAFSRLTTTGSSLHRLVVDRTGLEGTYDLELRFTPDNMPPAGLLPPDFPAIDATGPSIFSAVEEQLGLKLDAQRGPVEVLVIDRVEPPTEN